MCLTASEALVRYPYSVVSHYWLGLGTVILIICWAVTVLHRFNQKAVRSLTLLCSFVLSGWLLVNIFKNSFPMMGTFSRHLWYSYYLFELVIPLVLIALSLAIDLLDSERQIPFPNWFKGLVYYNVFLFFLVMTNDWHFNVFQMDLSSSSWASSYVYSWGYYLVMVTIFIEALLAQLIMFYKNKSDIHLSSLVLPFVFYLALSIFCIGFTLRWPLMWRSSPTIVTSFFVLLYMEGCIRLGFLPVNTKYRLLFEHAPQNMQIVDLAGRQAFASQRASKLDDQLIQNILSQPDQNYVLAESSLLVAEHINGGMVIWEEDIGSIHKQQAELAFSLQRLEVANAMMEREEDIQGRLASTKARLALFADLELEIASCIQELSELLHNLPKVPAERQEYMARLAILVCYLKRSCNLFFLEQKNVEIGAYDLALYLDELAEFTSYAGFKCFCTCDIAGTISIRWVTLIYDFFYLLLEGLLDKGNRVILLQVMDENDGIVTKVMSNGEIDKIALDSKFLDDVQVNEGNIIYKNLGDSVGVWLSFARGGR